MAWTAETESQGLTTYTAAVKTINGSKSVQSSSMKEYDTIR